MPLHAMPLTAMPLAAIAPLAVVVRRLDRWSVESQQRARRNAMVAATALAQRRAEREDVEDYFASLTLARHPAPAAATPDRPATGVRAAR